MATESILVADPDAGMAELFTQLFEMEDYKVVYAQSLADALALLSEAHVNLVITEAFDQQDAFEFNPAFLSTLKAAAGKTPIILCSIYPSTDYLNASDYGLAEVVHKPFDIDELLEKVQRVLGEPLSRPRRA